MIWLLILAIIETMFVLSFWATLQKPKDRNVVVFSFMVFNTYIAIMRFAPGWPFRAANIVVLLMIVGMVIYDSRLERKRRR